jgi:hypothetical protein
VGNELLAQALLAPLHRILEPLPARPAVPGEYSASAAYQPDAAWGIPEQPVFQYALASVRADGRRYEVRIGKGSQIYSIVTPAGQFIGPQRAHSAEWVDEVLQTVSVNRALNDRTHTFVQKAVAEGEVRIPLRPQAYFIHQAGTYNRDIEYPGTFYSPLLATAATADGRGYSTLVWPQQAHVPNNHRSEMLVYQHVRWVEPGVLEVTSILHNFGQVVLDRNNLPWVGLAQHTLPHAFIVERREKWRAIDHTWGAGGKVGQFPIEKTGGAVVFATGLAADDEGLALIFGADDASSRPFRARNVQLGGLTFLQTGATKGRGEHNLQVTTVISHIPIRQHQSLAVRYYVALGNRHDLTQAVKRYAPLSYRRLVDLAPTASLVGSLVLESTAAAQPVARWVAGPAGGAVHSAPFAGSQPLFVLEAAGSGVRMLSTNPYALSPRPHDGRTVYHGLLGFIAADQPDFRFDVPLPLVR